MGIVIVLVVIVLVLVAFTAWHAASDEPPRRPRQTPPQDPRFEDPRENRRPVPDPSKGIEFINRCFVLTGSFTQMTRVEVGRRIEERGGVVKGHVSRFTDYVVVGGENSDGWKFGNHGTKIRRAIELIENGSEHIHLVDETRIVEALQKTSGA